MAATASSSNTNDEQLLKLVRTVAAGRDDIRLWLGASEFGVLAASCVFGANLVQLYIYATSGRRDPLWVAILVCWVWALDTIHTGFIWAWLFDKTVLDAADLARTLMVFDMTDALSFSVVFSGLLGASVQSFYAYRLYRLARHPWFSLLSWAGSIARAGLSVAVAVFARRAKTLIAFTKDYHWTVQAVLGVSVGVDVFNTMTVCIMLARQRDGVQMTSNMISKLTLWTVETGFLTSAVALTMLGLSLGNRPSVIPALLHVYAKLFAFSLLVTLNGRERLRQAISSSAGAITPLSPIRPAIVSVTNQREFELTRRSFRSHGQQDPELQTKQSLYADIGVAHGDPESPKYRREDELKTVAPWDSPEPVPELHPTPRPHRSEF